MKELLEEFLLSLVDGQNISQKIAELILEGYEIRFEKQKYVRSPGILVRLMKIDENFQTKAEVVHIIDPEFLLER